MTSESISHDDTGGYYICLVYVVVDMFPGSHVSGETVLLEPRDTDPFPQGPSTSRGRIAFEACAIN